MRPINLTPLEQRRGDQSQLRSGPLAYLLLGSLVAVLVAVTALVLTGNQIEDREAEVATLEAEDTAEAAKAEKLAAFVEFRDLREARLTTISSLADSRFDWERVMRELALILPQDAWLVELTATASPQATVESEGSGETNLRASIPGPALELTGCATGQQAVAGFVRALKDIEGVTRVAVGSSELPSQEEKGPTSGRSEGDECRTRQFIAKFEIVVAFDAAPIPPSFSTEGVPPPATEQPTSEESSSEESGSGESEEAG